MLYYGKSRHHHSHLKACSYGGASNLRDECTQSWILWKKRNLRENRKKNCLIVIVRMSWKNRRWIGIKSAGARRIIGRPTEGEFPLTGVTHPARFNQMLFRLLQIPTCSKTAPTTGWWKNQLGGHKVSTQLLQSSGKLRAHSDMRGSKVFGHLGRHHR